MKLTSLICLIIFTGSCNNRTVRNTPAQNSEVKDSVAKLMQNISKEVSEKGPVAWLQIFENSPGFFMVSDGQLQFPDNDSAHRFISHTLIKMIPNIDLKWHNLRIDPLTNTLAAIGADFHEDITTMDQRRMPVDGYFTALAENGAKGWQLRNAHWSIKKNTPS